MEEAADYNSAAAPMIPGGETGGVTFQRWRP